jgi:Arc/MetJ-type ribon-helix-helix transcriptional regulator
MYISLPTELEDLVLEKVANGQYRTTRDVFCKALRLLQERDGAGEIAAPRLRLEARVDAGPQPEPGFGDADYRARLESIRSRLRDGLAQPPVFRHRW